MGSVGRPLGYWKSAREWNLGVLAPLAFHVLSGYEVSNFVLLHTPVTLSLIINLTAKRLIHQALKLSKP